MVCRSDHEVLPLDHGDRTVGLVSLTVDQVALRVEVVVNVGVDGSELL